MDEVKEAQIVFYFLTKDHPELLEHQKGKELLLEACKIIATSQEAMEHMGTTLTRTIIKMDDGRIIDFGDLNKTLEDEPIKYLN